MEQSDKSSSRVLWIVAIVGIVAIVLGYFGMNKPSQTIGVGGSENLVGQADVPITPVCVDSDDGRNYYIQGTTCIGNNCATDFCWNYNFNNYGTCSGNQDGCVLAEHWCITPKKTGKITYDCPYGCMNGACVIGDENQIIRKDMYFLLTNVVTNNTYLMQYKGADNITNDNPLLKFIDITTGNWIEQTYTNSIPLATLKVGGYDYGVYKAPEANIYMNNFSIQIDLNGDGILG